MQLKKQRTGKNSPVGLLKPSKCPVCELYFEQNTSLKPKKFCTKRCSNTGATRIRKGMSLVGEYPPKLCKHCDTEFIPSKKGAMYCTSSCKDSWNSKHKYRYAYQKECRTRSPRSYLSQLRSYYNRKETLSLDFLEELFHSQLGLCAVTGIELTHSPNPEDRATNISIDRIDSSEGYSAKNVQLTCYMVNIMKSSQTMEELLFWCDAILNGSPTDNRKSNLAVQSKSKNRSYPRTSGAKKKNPKD